MIVRWRRLRPLAPIDEYTFVDLGAGMGRAVLLAARYPFRAAIGIELHPTLARIARKNLAHWRAAQQPLAPMKIHCADALSFRIPPGPCVVFLFNPFAAPVLRRLAASWSRAFAARPAELDILYVNHEQAAVLDRQPGFARLYRGQVPRSRADAIADHRILANQPEGEYASANFEDCSIYRWTGTSIPG
jgi:SAM-dependent methyltransferase